MPSWHAAKSWSGRLPARSTPSLRQQLADAPHRMIGKTGEDIGEPSLRVDAFELSGLDQRVDGGGAPSAFVGAGKRCSCGVRRDAAKPNATPVAKKIKKCSRK